MSTNSIATHAPHTGSDLSASTRLSTSTGMPVSLPTLDMVCSHCLAAVSLSNWACNWSAFSAFSRNRSACSTFSWLALASFSHLRACAFQSVASCSGSPCGSPASSGVNACCCVASCACVASCCVFRWCWCCQAFVPLPCVLPPVRASIRQPCSTGFRGRSWDRTMTRGGGEWRVEKRNRA